MTKVSEYHIDSMGLDDPQYFSGAGIVGTRWEDVAVGCGDTEAAAYDDAREALAQRDWDVSSLPSAVEAGLDDKLTITNDMLFYVAIYVR